MSDPVIRVESLSKRYRLGLAEQRPETLVGALKSVAAAPLRNLRHLRRLDALRHDGDEHDTIWALRDVSFEVARGEVVGIVGHNGAGKSTLLKILSRITEPSAGRVRMRGRVSALLEVGTGFHPELTGRENVYMNGTILGMTKREIDRKFDQIVAFSGVEKFLDTPTKHYSSGMRVRLAFAVAAHLEPEVLIVDEVLAVGDQQFQAKCLGKMHEVTQQDGRTILFVSHNMAAVDQLCSRAIVLRGGRIIADGDVEAGIAAYLEQFRTDEGAADALEAARMPGMTPVIRRVEVLDARGRPTTAIPAGEAVEVRIGYDRGRPLAHAHFGVLFENSFGQRILLAQTRFQVGDLRELPPRGEVRCRIPSLPLTPSRYYMTTFCTEHRKRIDEIKRGFELDVVESNYYGTGRLPKSRQSLVLAPAEWQIPTDGTLGVEESS
jgi:lipopolysaccharide transport system ATP-binding protein